MPAPPRRASVAVSPRPAPLRTVGVAKVARLDNVTRAYEELRRVIVWGQLGPGSRISERIVAERLGLSRTPVRSALHRLEQEGFVAAVGSGRERRLIVAPLTMQDGQEVYALVGHLEGLAARIAAGLPAAPRLQLVDRLRTVNDELAAHASAHGDAAHFFDLDSAFHRSYVEGVVGPRLLGLHRAIKPQGDRYSRLYVSVFVNQVTTSVREHETIIHGIARGDRDAAQRAAEMNWRNAAERLATVIEQHGERGNWEAWGGDPLPLERSDARRPHPAPAKKRRSAS